MKAKVFFPVLCAKPCMLPHVCTGMAAAQWLGLRLQAIASVLVTLVALLAVLGHEDLLPFATGSSKFAASKPSCSC